MTKYRMEMTIKDIETVYDVKMTNDELMTFFRPDNVPRSPTSSEVNAIMESGMEDPEEYILTWFYDKGGEGKFFEIEGDGSDGSEYNDIEI